MCHNFATAWVFIWTSQNYEPTRTQHHTNNHHNKNIADKSALHTDMVAIMDTSFNYFFCQVDSAIPYQTVHFYFLFFPTIITILNLVNPQALVVHTIQSPKTLILCSAAFFTLLGILFSKKRKIPSMTLIHNTQKKPKIQTSNLVSIKHDRFIFHFSRYIASQRHRASNVILVANSAIITDLYRYYYSTFIKLELAKPNVSP